MVDSEKKVREIFGKHPFVTSLKMNMEIIAPEGCLFSMNLTEEIHGNTTHSTHGGALMSLLDIAMGASCAVHNYKVVTLNMQTDFYLPAVLGDTIYARSRLIHQGKTILGAEAEIRDSKQKLLVKTSATFFIIGSWQ